MKNKCLNLTWCVLLGFGAAQAAPAPYFITDISVTELPTPGAADSVALDINDKGEIVGWFKTVNDLKHAFLYHQGLMEDITFGALSVAEARGINNYSQVVGRITGVESDVIHGFYYDNGAISFLDEIDPATCSTGSSASAINDAGLIVGEHRQGCGFWTARPAKWSSYTAPWKGLLPSYVVSLASTYTHNVNSIGMIVGEDTQGIASFTGGWYSWFGTLNDVPRTIGTPPEWYYPSSEKAFGVNSYGRIVGETYLLQQGLPPQPDDGFYRAYYWDGVTSASQGLPILGDGSNAGAREINDQEFIAGWADRWIKPASALEKRAAVWYQGKITMLPLPAGIDDIVRRVPTVCEANAVNNMSRAGIVQVVGYCQVAGKTEAMLWTLKTSQLNLVPHP